MRSDWKWESYIVSKIWIILGLRRQTKGQNFYTLYVQPNPKYDPGVPIYTLQKCWLEGTPTLNSCLKKDYQHITQVSYGFVWLY